MGNEQQQYKMIVDGMEMGYVEFNPIEESETCGRCGRKLKTEKSRMDGYGPVCKRKVEAEKVLEEGEQE